MWEVWEGKGRLGMGGKRKGREGGRGRREMRGGEGKGRREGWWKVLDRSEAVRLFPALILPTLTPPQGLGCPETG